MTRQTVWWLSQGIVFFLMKKMHAQGVDYFPVFIRPVPFQTIAINQVVRRESLCTQTACIDFPLLASARLATVFVYKQRNHFLCQLIAHQQLFVKADYHADMNMRIMCFSIFFRIIYYNNLSVKSKGTYAPVFTQARHQICCFKGQNHE